MRNTSSSRALCVAAVAILCVLAFSGCEKQSPVSPESDTILGSQTTAGVPLAVGNTWVYKRTSLDSSGAIVNTGITTTEIVRACTLGTQQWFVARTTEGGTSSETLLANINGAHYYRFLNDTVSLLYLQFPSGASRSFAMDEHFPGWPGHPDTILHVPCTVSSLPGIVRVPMGRFFAYKYTAPDTNVTYSGMTIHIGAWEMYLSDIGEVELISYSKTSKGQYVSGILELLEDTIR